MTVVHNPVLPGSYRLLGFSVVLLAAAGTSGCGLGGYATAETTGIVVGGTVGGATGDPLIGLAAGLLSSWAVKAGLEHYEVSRQAALQDVIARAAGSAEVEQATSWVYGDFYGELEVTRAFGRAIPCKELVYTVHEQKRFVYHVGTVCKSRDRWEWAVPHARVGPWTEQPDPVPSGPHQHQHPFEDD